MEDGLKTRPDTPQELEALVDRLKQYVREDDGPALRFLSTPEWWDSGSFEGVVDSSGWPVDNRYTAPAMLLSAMLPRITPSGADRRACYYAALEYMKHQALPQSWDVTPREWRTGRL